MRILQINKYHYMRRGAERYYLELSRLLERAGHEVIPFAMRHPKNEKTPYSKFFVSELDLTSPGLASIKNASRFIYSLEARDSMEALIEKTRPDIAHVHNIYHQISPSILPVLAKHGIPVVMTVHDYKLICPNYSLFTQGSVCERCNRYRYYNAVVRKCLKQSRVFSSLAAVEMYVHHVFQRIYERNIDAYVAPSKFVKRELERFGRDVSNVHVIPHFVKSEGRRSKAVDRGRDGQLPVQGGKYILYFGALVESKGVDILFDMMYNIKSEITLKIAGSGPQLQNLKTLAKRRRNGHMTVPPSRNIEFLGHLDDKELAHAIEGCEFVVMPSRAWETFGLSALEAMQHGKPVIASRMGALPEVVQHGKTGLLVKNGDAKAFAKAADRLLSDKALLARMGKAAASRASEFSEKNHLEQILSFYDEVLDRKSRNDRSSRTHRAGSLRSASG